MPQQENRILKLRITGKLWNSEAKGTYYCAVCGNLLFRSTAKFASDCGWPSFFETERKNSVIYRADHSAGMERTEVYSALRVAIRRGAYFLMMGRRQHINAFA